MPRKRDRFVPLGDVAEAVELPDGRAMTRRAGGAAPLHPARQSDAARRREQRGRRARLHGEDAGVVQPATQQPRHSATVHVNGPYTLYMTATGSAKLPYGNIPRLLLAWVSTEAVPR